MEYNYYNLFLLFFIYSIIGYIVESTSVSLTEKKIVLNRGFLIGPYIPIFGYGSIAMILALQKYKNDIIALFIMSMIVCLTIEYLCSLIAEKYFTYVGGTTQIKNSTLMAESVYKMEFYLAWLVY